MSMRWLHSGVSTGKLLRTAGWMAMVYAILTACALAALAPYGRTVLPFYRWELGWIAPHYELRKLELTRAAQQTVFWVTAADRDYLFVYPHQPPQSLYPEFGILAMNGLTHVVLVLFVPLAWPGISWRRRFLALVLAVPVLGAMEFIDVPCSILGRLDEMRASYTHASASLASLWYLMLDTGGRFALSLAGGVLALGSSRMLK